MRATISGNEAEMKSALKKVPDVNAAVPDADAGAFAGSSKRDTRCPDVTTPLQAAACRGRAGPVRLLLANRANPNLAGTGKAPLLFAASDGNVEIATLLLDSGAQPDVQSAGQTALTAAHSVDMVKLLLTYKANPALPDGSGYTPLVAAAASGNRDSIRLLLAAGAKPTAAGSGGLTPLMLAANADCAKTLLAAQADLNAQDDGGNTALMHAAQSGYADVAKVLLDLGADVRARNRAGATAANLARPGETKALIRGEFERLVRRDLARALADADRAAAAGDRSAALASYLASLSQASQLGKGPEREVRIRFMTTVATWPSPPAVPDAAREHLVRAEALLKHNRPAAEVESELQKAIAIAPWWAEGYFNLGLVEGNGGRYKEAIDTLTLFVSGAPNNPQVQAAKDKIVEFQIGQEEQDAIAGLAGKWRSDAGVFTVSMMDDRLKAVGGNQRITITASIKDRVLTGSVDGNAHPGENDCEIPAQSHPVMGKIDAAGTNIDLQYVWANYATHYRCVTIFNEVVPCGGIAITSTQCEAVTITGTSTVNLRLTR